MRGVIEADRDCCPLSVRRVCIVHASKKLLDLVESPMSSLAAGSTAFLGGCSRSPNGHTSPVRERAAIVERWVSGGVTVGRAGSPVNAPAVSAPAVVGDSAGGWCLVGAARGGVAVEFEAAAGGVFGEFGGADGGEFAVVVEVERSNLPTGAEVDFIARRATTSAFDQADDVRRWRDELTHLSSFVRAGWYTNRPSWYERQYSVVA